MILLCTTLHAPAQTREAANGVPVQTKFLGAEFGAKKADIINALKDAGLIYTDNQIMVSAKKAAIGGVVWDVVAFILSGDVFTGLLLSRVSPSEDLTMEYEYVKTAIMAKYPVEKLDIEGDDDFYGYSDAEGNRMQFTGGPRMIIVHYTSKFESEKRQEVYQQF